MRSGKNKHSSILAKDSEVKKTNSGFSFKLYGSLVLLLLGAISGINWLVDPLWYSHGNILTGKNFAFNERVTKTNLYLRTKDKVNYNCLILGSSRAIALNSSNFQQQNCFNYALKGGEIEDFIDYAKFLKETGLTPKKVYIGVDGLNFVIKTRKEREAFDVNTVATQSFTQAYLSADVFLFSVMTLLGISPDPSNYYDRNFEVADFAQQPIYRPDFYKPQSQQKCDLSIVEQFANLRQIFPKAEFIGYIPPVSAWSIVNDTYGRGLMDCQLTVAYQLAQSYDVMYDFTVPSRITKNPDLTFDGSHYSVAVNDEIADILQGKPVSFGLKVNKYSFEEYRRLYLEEIRKFLAEHDQLKRWQGEF